MQKLFSIFFLFPSFIFSTLSVLDHQEILNSFIDTNQPVLKQAVSKIIQSHEEGSSRREVCTMLHVLHQRYIISHAELCNTLHTSIKNNNEISKNKKDEFLQIIPTFASFPQIKV